MRFAWSLRSPLVQATFLLFFALVAGTFRQLAPHGISWTGRWPTDATRAEDAYKMMAKAGDPAFVGLDEAIRLQETKSAVFLDARSSSEYAAGHIPEARNLPYYELEATQSKALTGLTDQSPIVIYCEGVGCELSFFLGRELVSAGFKNVRIFYGGYPEWSGAGLPVQK